LSKLNRIVSVGRINEIDEKILMTAFGRKWPKLSRFDLVNPWAISCVEISISSGE
jgi:hypothetical protein